MAKPKTISVVDRPKGIPFGPYVEIRDHFRIQFTQQRQFIVAIYGAYNAMGLIGPEFNGIVILDDVKMKVVCDEIAKADSGYFGASKEQAKVFQSLKEMDWPTFRDFVNQQPRIRYQLRDRYAKKRTGPLDPVEVKRFVTLAGGPYISYNAGLKQEFAKLGLRLADQLAGSLGLNQSQYTVRYNPGGIAVCGDIYLHSDHLYVDFSQSLCREGDSRFMFRHCDSQRDYTGGRNQYLPSKLLETDYPKVVSALRECMKGSSYGG